MRSLVVYLTAGSPNERTFIDVVKRVADAGADYLEIGLPPRYAKYDGPVIRRSYEYVKSSNIDVWSAIRRAVEVSSIPIILLTYLEDHVNRFREFVEKVREVGIESILLPDLLIDFVDEYKKYIDVAKSMGVKTVLFVSPSMPDRFIEEVSPISDHFLYYGIRPTTGIPIPVDPSALVRRVRSFVRNKLIVGFGLSIDDITSVVRAGADGVAIGSAVVERLERNDVDGAIEIVKMVRGVLDGVG